MGLRRNTNDAAVKDAQIMLRKEECAGGMGLRSKDAAVKVVQTKSGVEESVGDMGRSAL